MYSENDARSQIANAGDWGVDIPEDDDYTCLDCGTDIADHRVTDAGVACPA